MKLVILALAVVFTQSAQATSIQIQESSCMTKQKNAASFALAQKYGIPVQNVVVKEFNHGMWTEMPGENSGSDTVVVEAEVYDTQMGIYVVQAKQIGTSGNCKITKVIPAKL